MNSNMTIGKKLFLSCGAALALTVAIAVVAFLAIGSLGNSVDNLASVQVRKVYLAGDLDNATSDMLAAERGILVRAYMKDPATMAKYNQDFNDAATRFQKALDELAPRLVTTEGKEIARNLSTARAALVEANDELYRLACDPTKIEASTVVYRDKANPLLKDASKQAKRLSELTIGVATAVGQDAAVGVSRTRWITGGLVVLALLVGLGVVFVILRLNKDMVHAVTALDEGADQIASAATQVSASSQSLAQGASEQAASLEETSSSTEEINSMTRKNADNSKSAAELMVATFSQIEDGNRKLEQMVVSMGEINASSEKISRIIKTIDEIAFQTNILALNAAVEAARAGEAGMGFAVVADEVRNLAQRAAQAAKDTAGLIEESIAKSNEGSHRLDEVAKAITGITTDAEKVKTLVDEVSVGSQEQARGLEQVAKAITQMEQVTQKTASSAEQSAAAGQQLNAQSESLRAVVANLTALVGQAEEVGQAEQVAGSPRTFARQTYKLNSHGRTGRSPLVPAKHTAEFPLEEEFKEI